MINFKCYWFSLMIIATHLIWHRQGEQVQSVGIPGGQHGGEVFEVLGVLPHVRVGHQVGLGVSRPHIGPYTPWVRHHDRRHPRD